MDNSSNFRYHIYRPFSPGTFPKEGFLFFEENKEGRYGKVDYSFGELVYSKPLSLESIHKYELTPVLIEEDLKGKEFYEVEDGERYGWTIHKVIGTRGIVARSLDEFGEKEVFKINELLDLFVKGEIETPEKIRIFENILFKENIKKSLTGDLRHQIIRRLHSDYFDKGIKATEGKMKKLAADLGATDQMFFWESAELAWVTWYRNRIIERSRKELGDDPKYIKTIYERVVDFYINLQPSYNASSSTKRIFQQYSTSAPIAYAAGAFCDLKKDGLAFEPSAGNGLLTIALPYEQTYVNELDTTRLDNLRYQEKYAVVTNQDASIPFADYQRKFDAVISNPPFGSLPELNRDFNGYKIRKLDHLMIAHALDTMKDDGRAALIIGDWTHFDRKGLIKDHRTFFNWLGKHYWIEDMININSQKLYNRQGTAFPLRMILISGRKEIPFGVAPKRSDMPYIENRVDSFEELWERVELVMNRASQPKIGVVDLLKVEIGKMEMELAAMES